MLVNAASNATSDLIDLIMNSPEPLRTIMLIVIGLILVVAVIAGIVDIILSIKYVKYNKKMNSAGLTGETVARKILDANDLQNIKVKTTGSIMFGNSYSHIFKKVRLRRRTVNKPSVSSLAMGSQKAALAVLDKEGDPDMKKRVKLNVFMYIGPLAFVPLMIVGFVIDYLVFSASGVLSIALLIIGVLFYSLALILSILTLKTEKKAQNRALELLTEEHLATDEEKDMMKSLFKLYNIEYINDIIMATLELIFYILQIVAMASGGSSSSSKK